MSDAVKVSGPTAGRTSPAAHPVRRGRPPQSAADAQAARARIVAATRQVFAERGSHALNVALIIERAGIARPTFYRYFGNAEEPLQSVLDECDRALVDGLQLAMDAAPDEVSMVVAGIDAYLGWAEQLGPVLRPLFAELHDPASPVSAHRERTLRLLRERLADRVAHLGRPAPLPTDIDVLLHTFEYVGFRFALAGPDDGIDVAWARTTMARIAVALLGSSADFAQVLTIPGLLPDTPSR